MKGRLMERGPRFGDNFRPDQTNRLDVLNNQDLPEYVDISREIRSKLQGSVETAGWPECPQDIESIDQFFEAAKRKVTERWNNFAISTLQDQLGHWSTQLPESEEYSDIKATLSSPEKLESRLAQNQFEILEPLRAAAPEAWRTLVLASSERQLAAAVLLRRWVKEVSESSLSKMGTTRAELELFLGMEGILGKYFDQAYVKQIELADAPGGKTKTSFGEAAGAEYLYDVYRHRRGQAVDLKTYAAVFPQEWPKITEKFRVLSKKVNKLLADGQLPESYRNLPAYLESLATVYGSDSVDIKQLDAMWKSLNQQGIELAESECPIMLIPQGASSVTGEAGKVDVELRFGFRTPETKKLEEQLEAYQRLAQNLVDANQGKLHKPYRVPKIFLNHQPFAHGPNLCAMTQGESGDGTITSHMNTIREATRYNDIPLLRKIFPTESMDTARYEKAAVIETGVHEFGHSVLSEEDDEAVKKRVGAGQTVDILGELKAETVGMKLVQEKLADDQSSEAQQELKLQFLAKLGTVCNYLANKSPHDFDGARYYYAGVAIISELLDGGAIVEQNGQYEVADPKKGVAAISDMGSALLDNFFGNTDQNPEEIRKKMGEYFQEIKAKEKSPLVNRFLTRLKA